MDWDGDGDVDVLKVARPGELHLHEQLFNGTFVLKVLPVPPVRDYTAADFDGDGDVDLLIAVPKEPGCRYFERTGDGSLKELKGNDNPFNSVCGSTGSLASSALNEEFKYFTLGDWDQDGDMDMIVVDAHDGVQLFKAQGVNHFLETPNSPFSTISLPDNMMVSLADLDADGDLDVIVPSHTYPKECCDMEYKYFERVASGDLVELHMAVPPLRAVPLTFFEGGTKSPFVFQRHLVADVDGDGDLDVVLGDYFSRDIQYAQQQDGQFIWLPDSRNPFYEVVQQIKDKACCCFQLLLFTVKFALPGGLVVMTRIFLCGPPPIRRSCVGAWSTGTVMATWTCWRLKPMRTARTCDWHHTCVYSSR